MNNLTSSEIDMILQSLMYTREVFENYKFYPTYEFKLQRIQEVETIRAKLIKIKRGSPPPSGKGGE